MQGQYDIKILCVEDDADTRGELLALLRRRARSVIEAADGPVGLEAFCKHTPDLVITDLRMPGMDGLGMIREIRRVDPQVKVVVMTAHNDSAYLFEAIQAGVNHYLMKPLQMERLDAAIHECAELILTRQALADSIKEKDKLIAELQQALERVKLLSGLLPICSKCKKIRNGEGGWEQLERYLCQHSEAKFSHGLCPDCLGRLFSEYGEA